ncbi:Phosphotyrosyl phosphatase activator [Martensiomyces pterosporus]|nr:Phosphotyrosyl phosphatase activator [Martensiomyces pterosporus]
MIPTRKILTPEDLSCFQTSAPCSQLVDFLNALNASIIGVKTGAEVEDSEIVKDLSRLLDSVKQVNEDVKPLQTNSRFGNPAFRDFYDALEERLPKWLEAFVPADYVEEVSKYALESFGNRRRIDYGTGHELNFLTFLLCLDRLGLIKATDYTAVVLHVFFKYVGVMRGLQLSYWLEPAGSHGVWGLDDYHFLPFLFGAGQLRTHKHLRPKSIHNPEILEEFSKDFMYFECVQFVNSIKTGSIRWHSPMIDDISGAKTWEKVNVGLIKMFRAEVLGKLPVMQHFMFGSLVSFDGGSMSSEVAHKADESEHDCNGHSHVYAFGQEFPECCGIKVPSAIAAAAAKAGMGAPSAEPRKVFARPIPFD